VSPQGKAERNEQGLIFVSLCLCGYQ